MRKRRNIILWIKPGTRKMQFTVTVNGELVDYGTKYFVGVWSKTKLKKILKTVEKLKEKYQPNKVEMKVPHPSRRSEGLAKLLNKLIQHQFSDSFINLKTKGLLSNMIFRK